MHASAVQGGDVLKIGTAVRARVVEDISRETRSWKAVMVLDEKVWRLEKMKKRAAEAAERAS